MITWMDEDIEIDWEPIFAEDLYRKIIEDKKNPHPNPIEDYSIVHTSVGIGILDNKRILLGDFS